MSEPTLSPMMPVWTGSLPVRPPFRLGLVVSALRRLPANPIEVLTPMGNTGERSPPSMGRWSGRSARRGPPPISI